MASSKVSLKFYIYRKNNWVLFAEASKEFIIDFLFNFLAALVGTFLPLLLNQEVLGSLPNIYESIKNISDTYYLQPNPKVIKDSLQNPKVYVSGACADPLQLPNVESSLSRCIYACSSRDVSCNRCISYDSGTVCPSTILTWKHNIVSTVPHFSHDPPTLTKRLKREIP